MVIAIIMMSFGAPTQAFDDLRTSRTLRNGSCGPEYISPTNWHNDIISVIHLCLAHIKKNCSKFGLYDWIILYD